MRKRTTEGEGEGFLNSRRKSRICQLEQLIGVKEELFELITFAGALVFSATDSSTLFSRKRLSTFFSSESYARIRQITRSVLGAQPNLS